MCLSTICTVMCFIRFFFNDAATTEIYTLSLHDALPIWPTWPGGRAPNMLASGDVKSIAVLPLLNLSDDPAQEYFADGMTDELIGTLGTLGGVNVISRTSSMQFKGSKKTAPEIAKALHVDAVLEGS